MASAKEDAREEGKEAAELFLPFMRSDVPDGSLWRLALKIAKWDAMPQTAGNVNLAMEYASAFVNVFVEHRTANAFKAIDAAKRQVREDIYGETTTNG